MNGEWDVDRLDLGAYLHRIRQPDGPPTGATLDRLHRAHVATIGFDNLAILLGSGVDPDLDAVQDKLVHRGRGGYCYEHAVLFAPWNDSDTVSTGYWPASGTTPAGPSHAPTCPPRHWHRRAMVG